MKRAIIRALLLHVLLWSIIVIFVINESGMQKFRYMGF